MKYLNIKILLFVFFLVLFFTFIIPSGQYIDQIYTKIDKPNMDFKFLLDSLFIGLSAVKGSEIGFTNDGFMIGAINLIFLIISVNAFSSLINDLNYFQIIINKITSFNINIKIITLFISLFFIINSSIQGMYETSVAFYPILFTLYNQYKKGEYFVIKLMVYSMAVGHIASTINPFFTLIITQNLKIPLTTDIIDRIILLIFLSIITCFVLTKKVENKKIITKQIIICKKQYISLILISVPYILMTVLLLPLFNYSLIAIATIFLTTGLLIGIYNKLTFDQILDIYFNSVSKIMPIVITIIIARSIYVLVESTYIIDTIVYYFTHLLENMNQNFIYVLVVFFFLIVSLFISSTSAISILLIPIFSPVLVNLNLNPNDLILLLQLPVGVMKIISPTSILVLSLIQNENVSIYKWIKSSYKFAIFILIFTFVYIIF